MLTKNCDIVPNPQIDIRPQPKKRCQIGVWLIDQSVFAIWNAVSLLWDLGLQNNINVCEFLLKLTVELAVIMCVISSDG